MNQPSVDSFPPRPRRDSVILTARVEAVDGAAECRVRNLSLTGACIDNVGNLRVGDRVLVTIGLAHHLEGSVRWAQLGRAGLCFERTKIDMAAARRPRGTVAPASRNAAGWLEQMRNPYRRTGG